MNMAAQTTTAAPTPSNVHQLLNMNKQLTVAANQRYTPALNLTQTKPKPATTGLTQQDAAETFRSLSATLSSLNSYTISLQNQLNLAAAKSATALAAGPTLAQAASVLSQANTLAQTISMYQQQQQQQQHQQSSLASIQSSLAAAAAAAAVTTSSSSTCSLNNTLFVGNLHASLQEVDLIQVFRPFGRIVECCKKWLHFGFVKFMSEEEACHAYVTLNGFRLKGRPMRLEFQNRTKKAILAQAVLTNSQTTGQATSASNPNDLLSMSSTLNGLKGLPFVPSSSTSSSSSGSSTPAGFLTEGSSFPQFHSSYSSSNLNGYFQALQMGQPSSLIGLGSKPDEQAAVMSLFNPDQLIKFANGVAESVAEKSDFGLGALTDEAIGINRAAFEFKLNDELIKDFQLSNLCEKSSENVGGDDLVSLLKKASLVSPNPSSSSPQHDLSSSSDSGCRSNSFLNDEDSACFSLSTSTVPMVGTAAIRQPKLGKTGERLSDFLEAKKQQIVDELTISEHMEFTCSNESSSPTASSKPESSSSSSSSSCAAEDEDDGDEEDNNEESDCDQESDCDTSDDASEIPSDTECLNEIDDLIDENFLMNAGIEDEKASEQEPNVIHFDVYNQVVEDDGSVCRKKLTAGIYKSMNQTLSLFIEPNDVLKPMSADEYNEYVLFPNRICEITMPAGCGVGIETSSYFVLKNAQVYLM